MRRVILITLISVSLAGCSSFSLDYFKPTPPTVQVQLESVPPGADARTSVGPGCKTPCSVALNVPDNGFSVSYSLNKFEPTTVPVQVVKSSGDLFSAGTATVDPNPVVAQLQPMQPPPKPIARKKMLKPKKPKPPAATAAEPADSAFPAPAAPAPGAAAPSR
jgi:hypothetical protein